MQKVATLRPMETTLTNRGAALCVLGLALGFSACDRPETAAAGYDSQAPVLVHPGDTHFIADFPARSESGAVNVVIEIPAGTDAKWEVTKPDGTLAWQIKDGKPRVVQYLGYPGNYGMVPRTLLPKD